MNNQNCGCGCDKTSVECTCTPLKCEHFYQMLRSYKDIDMEIQDEIQEDTTSMEEKLEALDELSACCGAWYTDARFCSACHEHC